MSRTDVERDDFLISYLEIRPWVRHATRYDYGCWSLDSGAFSAKTKGVKIDNAKFIEDALELGAQCPRLEEVFALDDIDDWKRSLRNVEEAWKKGLQATPTFHFGEPWDVLLGYARDYPKVALGGVALAGMAQKRKAWIGQCFARVWPKRMHGFGIHQEDIIFAFPFESVDATSWMVPGMLARSRATGGARVKGRPRVIDAVRLEVERSREMRTQAMSRWRTSKTPFKNFYFAGNFAGRTLYDKAIRGLPADHED